MPVPARIRCSASFVPRITPWRLMSIIRRAVRSSSSMNLPTCMIPALFISTSTGPLGFGVVQEPCNDSRSVTSRLGDRRRPQLGGGLLRRLDVEVADRHAHAGSGQRLGRGAPDPARRRDRGMLAGQDALTWPLSQINLAPRRMQRAFPACRAGSTGLGLRSPRPSPHLRGSRAVERWERVPGSGRTTVSPGPLRWATQGCGSCTRVRSRLRAHAHIRA